MTNEEIENLILQNEKLAYSLVNKYFSKVKSFIEYDDLKSTALLGLVKAANTYNIDKQKFSTYAYTVINNEILMLIRTEKKSNRFVSLDNEIDNNITYLDIFDTGEDIEVDYIRLQDINKLNKYIEQLPEKLKKVIRLRLDGLTQEQIGKELNISQATVSNLYYLALNSLRLKFELEGDILDEYYR